MFGALFFFDGHSDSPIGLRLCDYFCVVPEFAIFNTIYVALNVDVAIAYSRNNYLDWPETDVFPS